MCCSWTAVSLCFFGLPFGAVFFLVGAAVGLGRSGRLLDLRNRSLTAWWGLLVPFSRRRHKLDEFDRVTISREVRQSKDSSDTVYPVRLLGDANKVSFGEPRDYFEARRSGERLAKFMQVPLADSGMGSEIVKSPELLGLSLRHQIRKVGDLPPLPSPPTMQCSIRRKGKAVMIQAQPRGGAALEKVARLTIMALSLGATAIVNAILKYLEALVRQTAAA